MSLKDILMGSGGALVVIATFLEISKIKINPWSSLFRFIGRCINAELIEKVDLLEASAEKRERDRLEHDAVELRRRILLFGDEVARGVLHSEEHFNQILSDMTDYETYCDNHHDFKNDKTIIANERIKEAYRHCLKTGDFL